MKTKLTIKPAYRLSKEEFNEHRRLSFRSEGQLFNTLSDHFFDVRSRVISLRDETGKLLSWGIVYYPWNSSEPWLQLYTRKPYRRMGYGSRVVNKAKKYSDKKLHVYYNSASQFFESVGLRH